MTNFKQSLKNLNIKKIDNKLKINFNIYIFYQIEESESEKVQFELKKKRAMKRNLRYKSKNQFKN